MTCLIFSCVSPSVQNSDGLSTSHKNYDYVMVQESSQYKKFS